MAVCITCSTDFPETLGACPQCRTPLSGAFDGATQLVSDGPDETRMASSGTDGGSRRPPTSTTGWLSSSGAIDHGRFTPGTLLGGRYRIVERLGRGGMGEVFRADDLKLGQPVALKFLPAEVDRDPARLTQLHTEVRLARQVSHPNVCRVYDIDEAEGTTFLSMEYVDGEDLASLLRRVGRFAEDRGIELSRQMCAGLAAAHERGVVHRDFKPANVMIDGTGRVRITDFGLAGVSGEAIRAGTPAYMAPEQMAGDEVTPRSDIYALGLVLYEVFTGKRALDGKTIAELVRQREETGITPPSQIVHGLDQGIERAIMRCLERDPARRPASALAVAAALPGGDPLAAALAAGETPSPEMVAAAAHTSALGALPAISALVFVLLSLVVFAGLNDRVAVTGILSLDKPPAVLADRAQQIEARLGYPNRPNGMAHGFTVTADYQRYLSETPSDSMADHVRSGRPPLVVFWYRTSPWPLVPTGDQSKVTLADPPLTISGMVSVLVDPQGRLVEFQAVPPQEEPEPSDGPAAAPDWDALFTAADLKRADFRPVPPKWTPRTHSDQRMAWEGPEPGWPDITLRVEAAEYRGHVVFFELIGPWTHAARMKEVPRSRTRQIVQTTGTCMVILLLLSAVLIARHNLRKGRGDRKGAIRLASVVFCAAMIARVIGGAHAADPSIEVQRLFGATGHALFASGVIWLLYVALEPYVRRFWPQTVVSWSRLFAGAWNDPHVGHDVLIGCVFGAIVIVIGPLYVAFLLKLGYPAPPQVPRLADLEGLRPIVDAVGSAVFNAVFNGLWVIFGLVGLRLLLKRVWAAAIVATVILSITGANGLFDTGPIWLLISMSLAVMGLIIYLAVHFGLLATMTFFFFTIVVGNATVTLDPSKWFFPLSMWMLAFGAAIAAYGFYASRGGEPLLGRRILD